MSCPTNPLGESNEECISDSVDDMPVNKITSFHGKLDRFLHASSSPDSTSKQTSSINTLSPPLNPTPEQTTPQNPSMAKDSPGPKTPRSKPKAKTKSILSSTIGTTRITRSRSRSQASSPSSSIPTTPIPIQLASPPISATRRRKRRPQVPADTPPASASLLRDTIEPNMILLLVGVNPGIQTYKTGFAYAHPSNLFWRLLHSSGITSVRHPPSDTYRLPALYSVGNTNIVERPTRDASMLTKAEMNDGVAILEAKVAAQRPEAVCLVGKGIWEAVWRVRHGREIRKEEFRYGWQVESENMGCVVGEEWGGAPVFVATTTSGLAAGMTITEKEAIWAELGGWVVRRRVEREVVVGA